ncbi:MAG: hypothetical protein ABH821_06330 [archaeon]
MQLTLTYNDLMESYRSERLSQSLVKLEPEFFTDLKSLVKNELQALESIISKNLESVESRQKQFDNLKKIISEFLFLRSKKILNKALLSFKDDSLPTENMVASERKLFEGISKMLKDYSLVLESFYSENVQKPLEVELEPDEKTFNVLRVELLKDVPAFVASDLKEYGPFVKGQEIVFPEKIAELLLNRKLAIKA